MSLTRNSKIKLVHCRFCAAKNQYDALIDFTNDSEMLKVYFTIIDFFKIDYIDLSLAHLPRTTCGSCCKSLQDAYNFFIKVKKTQQYLKKFYRQRTDRRKLTNLKTLSHTQTNTQHSEKQCNIVNVTESATIPNLKNIEFINTTNNIQAPILELPIFYQINVEDTTNVKTNEFVDEGLNLLQIDTSDIVATYCGVPVYGNDEQMEVTEENFYQNFCDIIFDNNITLNVNPSWTSYKWFCLHCNLQCENMDALRAHCKDQHNTCYAYNCIDCTDRFNTFNAFIEHVRMHREELR